MGAGSSTGKKTKVTGNADTPATTHAQKNDLQEETPMTVTVVNPKSRGAPNERTPLPRDGDSNEADAWNYARIIRCVDTDNSCADIEFEPKGETRTVLVHCPYSYYRGFIAHINDYTLHEGVSDNEASPSSRTAVLRLDPSKKLESSRNCPFPPEMEAIILETTTTASTPSS